MQDGTWEHVTVIAWSVEQLDKEIEIRLNEGWKCRGEIRETKRGLIQPMMRYTENT